MYERIQYALDHSVILNVLVDSVFFGTLIASLENNSRC